MSCVVCKSVAAVPGYVGARRLPVETARSFPEKEPARKRKLSFLLFLARAVSLASVLASVPLVPVIAGWRGR